MFLEVKKTFILSLIQYFMLIDLFSFVKLPFGLENTLISLLF